MASIVEHSVRTEGLAPTAEAKRTSCSGTPWCPALGRLSKNPAHPPAPYPTTPRCRCLALLQRQEQELGELVDGFEGFASLDGPGTIRQVFSRSPIYFRVY